MDFGGSTACGRSRSLYPSGLFGACVSIALDDILRARDVIRDVVRHTPMKRSTTLSKMTGGDVHLKLENFQRTGSFKVRGAMNKLASLTDEERARGVVAASAGNHAQGVAFAATHFGVRSDVFMPEDATLAKAVATKGYGAEVHLDGKDYQDAFLAAKKFQDAHNKVFVHAFDDPHIIAGQGTMGLEILDDVPDVETVVVPIGGGGLMSGIATAIKAQRPDVRIVGVQAAGASTVAPSLQKGEVVELEQVKTMADGIACRRLGDLTFGIMQDLVDEVVTVEENDIAAAILFLVERTKTVVEGAGAVTLAAAMTGVVNLEGQKACIVVSGGNIDITLLSRIISRGLVAEGRIAVFDMTVPDRPGSIASVLELLAKHKANVLDVRHDRHRVDVPLHVVSVEVHVETRGPEHVLELTKVLEGAGHIRTVRELNRP